MRDVVSWVYCAVFVSIVVGLGVYLHMAYAADEMCDELCGFQMA